MSAARLDSLLEAVIDDPTNLEKNFTLLEEQTRTGDLLGASASLERILILDPDSKLARVLLSEVQFNLGNLTSAKFTLTELQNDNSTPAEMLVRVNTILDAITRAESQWRYSAAFSFNRGSAKNPRGASSSQTILLSDIEITNDASDDSEAFYDTMVMGKVSYALPSQSPRALEATAVAYHRDYLFYDPGDLTSLQLSMEYHQRFEPPIIVGTKISNVVVNEETYSTSTSGYGQISTSVVPKMNLTAFAETSHSNNFDTLARGSARDYNGFTNTVTVSASSEIFDQPVQLSGSYSRADPEAEVYQNTSRSMSFSTSTTFTRAIIGLSAIREWVHYRIADSLVSATKREDVSSTGALNLTVPLRQGESTSASLTAKASYSSVESSLSNYDKDSAEFHIGVTVNTY
ncbi:MAG: tetratricopeptide repeat protein [Alphaproteobacteria bacterium]|nr:tetratricopeptide repeat protein [Alphaproteobacteria bacterium]